MEVKGYQQRADDAEAPCWPTQTDSSTHYLPVVSGNTLRYLQINPGASQAARRLLERNLADWPTTHPAQVADVCAWNRRLVRILFHFEHQLWAPLCWKSRDSDCDWHSTRALGSGPLHDVLAMAYWLRAQDEQDDDDSDEDAAILLGHLRGLFPSAWDSELRTWQDSLHHSLYTSQQLEALSLCNCFVTIGLIGRAIASDSMVDWSLRQLDAESSEVLQRMLDQEPPPAYEEVETRPAF